MIHCIFYAFGDKEVLIYQTRWTKCVSLLNLYLFGFLSLYREYFTDFFTVSMNIINVVKE